MSAATADNFFADHAKYLIAALFLHVVVVVLLTVTINSSRQAVVPAQLAIKATIVDNSAKRIKREKEQAEAARERERVEAEKKQAEEAEARKEEDRQEEERQVKQAEEKRQLQLVADKKQKAEAERVAVAKKKAADDKKRAADIKTKQAEKQKAELDAREQAQREAELKRQLADEDSLTQAQNSGLSQYAALIEQRVVSKWTKPPTARPGIQCEVKVTQAPGGTVLSVQIDKCNGDAAVQRSIKMAVELSSPLPPPPDPRLFQRVIVFVFKPRE